MYQHRLNAATQEVSRVAKLRVRSLAWQKRPDLGAQQTSYDSTVADGTRSSSEALTRYVDGHAEELKDELAELRCLAKTQLQQAKTGFPVSGKDWEEWFWKKQRTIQVRNEDSYKVTEGTEPPTSVTRLDAATLRCTTTATHDSADGHYTSTWLCATFER